MTAEITHFSWRRKPKVGPNLKGKYYKRIDYGLVSFKKDGVEYDIDLIIREKPYPHPFSSTTTVNQITGGINVAGYDLYYPKDFDISHEYPFVLTQDYRKKQELKQNSRLEKKRQNDAEKARKNNADVAPQKFAYVVTYSHNTKFSSFKILFVLDTKNKALELANDEIHSIREKLLKGETNNQCKISRESDTFIIDIEDDKHIIGVHAVPHIKK